MKIAINNLATLDNGVIQCTDDANALFDVNNLLDPSFSTRYGSAGGSFNFVIRYAFTVPTLIDYVGIAGHNAGIVGAEAQVFVDDVLMLSYKYIPTNFSDFSTVLMATFPPQLATNIDVKFINKAEANRRITLCNIQIGETFQMADPVNNSEMAGYIRPWLATGINDKAILNRRSEPTVSLTNQQTKRLSLTLDNMQGISQNPDFDILLQFLNQMIGRTTTTWFMQERDGFPVPQDGTSNYLCYNGEMMVTAGKARELNKIKITFNAYIGTQA